MNIVARAIRKLERTVRFEFRRLQARRKGVLFSRPDYIYLDRFGTDSIVVDVGCGHVAEFSKHVMEAYGAKAYGVDPTRKHAPFLKQLGADTNGAFVHLPLAVTSSSGRLQFKESAENESGSVLDDHRNVLADTIVT